MGLFDTFKAAASEAKKAASEVAKGVRTDIEKQYGDQEWYQDTKKLSQEALEVGGDVVRGASALTADALDRVGQTDAGKAVGSASKEFMGALAKLPGLSVTGDIIRSRHGIHDLLQNLQDDPRNPERHIFLADAMNRAQREQSRYTRVRSTLDPSYLLTQGAVSGVTTLGQDDDEPSDRRLRRNAFGLAIQRLERHPANARSLHCIARVYLAEEKLGEAVRFAKLAHLADTEDGLPLVTLARCYQALGQHDNAETAADLAIQRGATVANEILAELTLADESLTPEARIGLYTSQKAAVGNESRALYWGVDTEETSVVGAVLTSQGKRLRKLGQDGEKLWNALK